MKRSQTDEQRILCALVAAAAVVYGSLAIHLSSYGAFWSPDSGARFAMIRNWIEHGELIYLRAPGATPLDPLSMYLIERPRGWCTTYPPLFPLLSGWLYRILGFQGLTVLPLVSGLGAILAIGTLAGRLKLRYPWVSALILGFGTPLGLYSAVFWDHSLHVLLVTLASWWICEALQRNSATAGAFAGLMMGCGVWLHELFLPLLVAATAGLLVVKHARCAVSAAVGASLPVLAWAATNVALYDSAGGPHLLGPNDLGNGYYRAHLFSVPDLVNRAMVELFGGPGEWLLASLLVATVAWSWTIPAPSSGISGGELKSPWEKRLAGRNTVLGVSLGITGLLAAASVTRADWAHGLFQATPVLLVAMVRSGKSRTGEGTAAFWRWARATCLLFGLFVIFNPITPGMDWGSRYLLTIAPLLVLLTQHVFQSILLDAERRVCGASVSGAAILFAASVWGQALGARAIDADMAGSQAVFRGLLLTRSPLVVTDLRWLAPEASSLAAAPKILLVTSAEDAGRLTSVLKGQPTVAYYGSTEGEAQVFQALEALGYQAEAQGEGYGLHWLRWRSGDPPNVFSRTGEQP